jgi:hypothetical protein
MVTMHTFGQYIPQASNSVLYAMWFYENKNQISNKWNTYNVAWIMMYDTDWHIQLQMSNWYGK